MKKFQVNKYPIGSFERVVAHAKWRRSRGRKNPSMALLPIESNPRKALAFSEHFAYFPEVGTYLDGEVPKNYICSKCGADHVKLWRGYMEMCPELLCAECAAKQEEKDISDIDALGLRSCGVGGGRTDQIGWQVPAVPTEDGAGYWGYTTVPGPGVDWWQKLQTRKAVS